MMGDGDILGRGRFSIVTKEKGSALKSIDLSFLRPPHSLEAELGALKQLKHPNIITLIESKVTNGFDPEAKLTFPFYAYTLERYSLANAKASFPPGSGWRNTLPISSVQTIGAKLANALDFIHQKGIIHRDIKPENIMFESSSSLEPVIIDFGIAWVPGIGESPKVCDVSSGSYKAPELLLGIESYSYAIDVWSLGCVLAKLVNKDCSDFFGEYNGDIALLGMQMCVLGQPDLEKSPTLAEKPLNWRPQQDLSAYFDKLGGLTDIIRKMLDWEMSNRPTAAEVEKALSG